MDQAEGLRNMIRNNTIRQKSLARVITVTSGKGGVGKSNIAVNLAVQFIKLDKKVIILDTDFGLANVEVMLGIRPRFSFADVIYGGKNIKDVITWDSNGLGFISGGSGISELIDIDSGRIDFITNKLIELDELADIIIIDTGAGISNTVLNFVSSSLEVILVSTPEPTSITDAYALLKTLSKKENFFKENTIIKVLANRVNSESEGIEMYNRLSVVVNKFLDINLQYIGSIPYDKNVSKAVIKQKPFSILYPNTSASKSIYKIAKILYKNEETQIYKNIKRGIADIFMTIFNKI